MILRGRDIVKDPFLCISNGFLVLGDAGENLEGDEGANIEADIEADTGAAWDGENAVEGGVATDDGLARAETTVIRSWSCRAVNCK
jgi:hypothetical protein